MAAPARVGGGIFVGDLYDGEEITSGDGGIGAGGMTPIGGAINAPLALRRIEHRSTHALATGAVAFGDGSVVGGGDEAGATLILVCLDIRRMLICIQFRQS